MGVTGCPDVLTVYAEDQRVEVREDWREGVGVSKY